MRKYYRFLLTFACIASTLAMAQSADVGNAPHTYFSLRQASNDYLHLQRFKAMKSQPPQLYIARDRMGDEWIADRRVLLDERLVASANVVGSDSENSSDDVLIQVVLTDEGRGKLEQITTELLNKQVGFFIDGALASGVAIRSVIKGGKFQVSVPKASRSELNAIAERLSVSTSTPSSPGLTGCSTGRLPAPPAAAC